MKRAEAVKAELVNAGIDESRIKSVGLGEEGVLCDGPSDVCRQMNRRVHLEIRKIGQEHMLLPPAPITSSDPSETTLAPSSTMEKGGSTVDGVQPSSSEPTTMLEPDSGH